MKYFLYCLGIFIAVLSSYSCLKNVEPKYFQNDYTITLKRVTASNINKDIHSSFKVTTFKYNRTTTSFNVSWTYQQEIEEMKKWYLNEYKRTSVQSTRDGCMVIKYNIFDMGRLFKTVGNATNCPIKKGYYEINNFHFRADQYPPKFLEGDFKAVLDFIYNKIHGVTFEVYVDVAYPVKIHGNH